MEWFNNANTIMSLVTAIIGAIGYAYGITTYLKKRTSSKQKPLTPSQAQANASQNTPTSYRQPFSWIEWTEAFAQGLVNTADFLIKIIDNESDTTDEPILKKIGSCIAICFSATIVLELLFMFGGSLFFSAIGINNGGSIGAEIGSILILVTFSLIYVYHVGLIIETKQPNIRKEDINNTDQNNR